MANSEILLLSHGFGVGEEALTGSLGCLPNAEPMPVIALLKCIEIGSRLKGVDQHGIGGDGPSKAVAMSRHLAHLVAMRRWIAPNLKSQRSGVHRQSYRERYRPLWVDSGHHRSAERPPCPARLSAIFAMCTAASGDFDLAYLEKYFSKYAKLMQTDWAAM